MNCELLYLSPVEQDEKAVYCAGHDYANRNIKRQDQACAENTARLAQRNGEYVRQMISTGEK